MVDCLKIKHVCTEISSPFPQEAENCIRELNAGPLSHFIVSEAVNIAIEKKMEQVEEVGSLLHSFTKSNLITIEHFKKG